MTRTKGEMGPGKAIILGVLDVAPGAGGKVAGHLYEKGKISEAAFRNTEIFKNMYEKTWGFIGAGGLW